MSTVGDLNQMEKVVNVVYLAPVIPVAVMWGWLAVLFVFDNSNKLCYQRSLVSLRDTFLHLTVTSNHQRDAFDLIFIGKCIVMELK